MRAGFASDYLSSSPHASALRLKVSAVGFTPNGTVGFMPNGTVGFTPNGTVDFMPNGTHFEILSLNALA